MCNNLYSKFSHHHLNKIREFISLFVCLITVTMLTLVTSNAISTSATGTNCKSIIEEYKLDNSTLQCFTNGIVDIGEGNTPEGYRSEIRTIKTNNRTKESQSNKIFVSRYTYLNKINPFSYIYYSKVAYLNKNMHELKHLSILLI